MDDFYILGEGSFGIVVGPFTSKDLNESGLFGKKIISSSGNTKKDLFVIKIYKDPDTEGVQQLINKQKLYTKLARISIHHSILFPLKTALLLGKNISLTFPFMKQQLRDNILYQVELQKYGGVELSNILFHKKKGSLRVDQFLTMWKCVPDILEDAYRIIFDNNMIITDVKLENMVLSYDFKLRLIDVDVNPNVKKLRINTYHIMNLPPQYFNRQWWHPSDEKRRLKYLEKYKKNEKKYIVKENKLILPILKFIHSYKDPYSFIDQANATYKDRQFQRLFFVMYPLLMVTLTLIVNQCVIPHTLQEKTHIKKITAFCIQVLRERGVFSNKFNYQTFHQFIWNMRSL